MPEPRTTDSQHDRVVMITGAAGGLGQALVKEFARDGWYVAATWHRHNPFPESDRLLPIHLNLADPTAITSTVASISSWRGRIDVLVNNAGITSHRAFWQLDETEWDKVLNVNLKGTAFCCREVVPLMKHQGDGHLIQIGSFTARTGARGQANYVAAKAGMMGLTTALAKELGALNIRANTVLPGVLPTAMTQTLSPERQAALASENVLGRINDLEEVARFIGFLAKTQNISGQFFQLDSRIAAWT